MKNKNPERLIFQNERDAFNDGTSKCHFVRDSRGWILFGPRDIRCAREMYLFCLQKLPKQKLPRVRVGCRYYTLKQAYSHWARKIKPGQTTYSNEGRQALAIIRLMLLQAQAYGLISFWSAPIKFDSSIVKSKRRA